MARAAIEVSPALEASSIAQIAQLVAMGSGIALLNPREGDVAGRAHGAWHRMN